MPVLTTPPRFLDSALQPANGDIVVQVSEPLEYEGDIVTQAAARGIIRDGVFLDDSGDHPFQIPATPAGTALVIWIYLNEWRDGRIQPSPAQVHQKVVPDVTSVTWDDLLDAVPAGTPQVFEVLADGNIGDVLTRVATGTGMAFLPPAAGTGGGTGSVDPEQVRDLIGQTLVPAPGGNITITPNDGANTVSIGVSGLTKSSVGLGNVDNTADSAKPVSTPQAQALLLKADDSATVHRTGTETIGGTKTFTSAPVVPAGSFAIDRVANLQLTLDGKVDTDAEIAAAALLDELSQAVGLISGRRLIAAIDALVGVQAIRWSGTAWMDSPRASAKVRLFFSQNDTGATAPLGMGAWDLWWQAPGS